MNTAAGNSGRTKGARSLKSTGFKVGGVLGSSSEQKTNYADLEKKFLRAESQIEKYEITNTVPQRTLILQNIENYLLELLPARYWEYKKWWWFVFCVISSLFGIGGCLWAMGETVLFADRKPDLGLMGACCTLFIPFFCWIKIVFFPHGANKDHLDEMTAKRSVRRQDDQLRAAHLEGTLPRPEKEIEIPDAPYEYQPDQPWLYVRWKPKPKKYYFYDSDGLAREAPHGSKEEEKAIEDETRFKELLNTQSRNRSLAEVAVETTAEVDDEEES